MRSLGEGIGARTPEHSNQAKQMARRLSGRIPVIIGAEALAPVAYRWRTQVNENAKQWAVADELPEMNHNAPVGYGLPAAAAPSLHVVLLRHAAGNARIALRIELTQQQMRAAGVAAEVLDVPGSDVLSQMLCGVHFGDFVSYYLGLLNDAHPSPVEALDWLKARMASS
jgi:glucose/mannose-6-phosphate isomerase